MASEVSTPINTISRENLTVLIRNNVLDDSVEFYSDCDTMETDSPVREPNLQPISKKLFHSPVIASAESPNERPAFKRSERKMVRKRKHPLIPESSENFHKVYIKECESDTYSPDMKGGMRKKVLISLFHNKEYSMDFS